MRRYCCSSRFCRFSQVFLLALFFGCGYATPLVAQRAPGTNSPKYDVHNESKMKGTVEEVRQPANGSKKAIVHLLIKSDTDTFDVYLCPKSFLDEMGISFSKQDEITLTGSKVKQGETDLILVREIVKGADTFMLRDEKGNPVWSEGR